VMDDDVAATAAAPLAASAAGTEMPVTWSATEAINHRQILPAAQSGGNG